MSHGAGFVQIRILFFGVLKDIVGRSQDELKMPEGSSVADILAHCESQLPGLKKSLSSVAIAVNQQYTGRDTKLREGDEVALLPPVSGGSCGCT
jgi:molybdopterin converting factor subunit 1